MDTEKYSSGISGEVKAGRQGAACPVLLSLSAPVQAMLAVSTREGRGSAGGL